MDHSGPGGTAAMPAPGGGASSDRSGGSRRGLLVAGAIAVVGGVAVGAVAIMTLGGDDSPEKGPQATSSRSGGATPSQGTTPGQGSGQEQPLTAQQIRAAAPRSLRVTADNGSAVTLQWRLPAVSRRLPILVERAPYERDRFGSAGNGVTNTVVSGLKPGTGYCFRVGVMLRPGTADRPQATVAWSTARCIRGARVTG